MKIIKNIKLFIKEFPLLFKMGADNKVSRSTKTILSYLGLVLFFGTWWLISSLGILSDKALPNPIKVISSYAYLFHEKHILLNTGFSIGVNVLGYIEAILLALPLGFLMGLFAFFNYTMSKPVDTARFLPLPIMTSIFVFTFGLTFGVKVHFLAVGIFVYLLPVVVQRIMEVDETLKQTMYTLGATKWQMLKKVYLPSVLSKLSIDIIVLIAISWTYIVVAEMIYNTGGVGALANTVRNESRYDALYAILLLVLIVGYIQDKLLRAAEKKIFKWKYV